MAANSKAAEKDALGGAPQNRRPEDHAARQREARALGDPTRYRVFRYVVEADTPAGVAEISEHLGVHHNAVRQHLAKLCHAGLLVEEVARRRGPGRPPLQYRIAPGAAGSWGTGGPYEMLSLLLLQLASGSGDGKLRPGPDLAKVAAAAAAAGRLAVSPAPVGTGVDPLDSLQGALAHQGCEPHRVVKSRSVELVLRRCPFEVAALADPKLICELHRGLAQGMVDALGDQLLLVGMVVRDPRAGDCRLRLRPAR